MADNSNTPHQDPTPGQVAATVAAVQAGNLAQGIEVPRPSGRMISDGGTARRKPPAGNSDPHAVAMQEIEDLHKRVAQIAEGCGQGDGALRISIELLQNSVSALQTTVGSLVEHVNELEKFNTFCVGAMKTLTGRVDNAECIAEGISGRVTVLERLPHG